MKMDITVGKWTQRILMNTHLLGIWLAVYEFTRK